MNMLIKEECEKALENLRVLERKDNFKKWGGQVAPQISCDVVEQLIKEHFELEQNFKILEKNYDDIYDIVHCPEPYKFEELKKGMWIWDDENEMFILITFIDKQFKKMHVCLTEYDGFNDEYVNVEYTEYFEEGRFFPVTKALEYQK